MKCIKLFFVALACCGSLCTFAQTQKFLPALAPSSPEAASFNRYGNYQVNLFTGIPEISIPLYEIKVGELSVPISLNYHSSGIKVTDVASRIGLGWDLQAGGSITRKIKGKADELQNNYLSATSTSNNRVKTIAEINTSSDADLDYLNSVDVGIYDVEPDIFSYSFPGHGGKFLFNQKNNFAAVLIPYAPVAVTMTPSLNNLALAMTDESGINYKFDATEWTTSGGGLTTSCTSAWLLSDMISANKQDTIHFLYVSAGGVSNTDSYFSDFQVLDDNCTGSYTGNTVGTFNTDFGYVSTQWKQMTQIGFKNGLVVFEAGPETREDINSLQKRLNAIKIYSYDPANNIYILIRSVNFFHSYFINGTDNTTKRLRLDSIQVRTGTGSVAQTYQFNYNTSVALPSNASRSKDYWGYFNNINNLDPFGHPTLIPKTQFQYLAPPNPPTTIWIGGDHTNARDPNPNYMQAYILQQIIFPTGGYTQFEYETNQYLDLSSNPKYAGGLRIKSIKSYTDNTATPIVKTYKYGPGESGYGRNNFLLEDHFFMSAQGYRKCDDIVGTSPNTHCSGVLNSKRTNTFFSNPTNDLESFDGAPVVYANVTEYIGDGTTNAGKTMYTFSDKTDVTQNVGYKSPILTSYHFVRGLLTNRSDYRRNADNSYTLVSENRKTYQYFPFQTTTGSMGLVVFKTQITENFRGLNYWTGCQFWSDSQSYLFYNYDILSGDNKLLSETNIAYDQIDPTKYISTTTNYTYDDLTHLGLSQTQTVSSKNENLFSKYSYPYNYPSTAPYPTMTANHIWDKIITEIKLNGITQLTLKSNNYASFSGNNFLPANIQLQVKSNPNETRATFNQYDTRGNILEMQKTNDVKQSIIWDYQGLQPIATVTNTGVADIAYTSFEADGKGNWTFTGASALDPTTPTGKRCYTLGSSITKSGLSTSTTYVVSYWKKSGTVSVNATTPVTGRSVNGWTYYEHTVVNPAGGLITVSGTSGIIDELRLYPSTAQMTTYTYAPLVGMTSQCGIDNRINYYEYDRLGRLMLVRDQDKNILKQVSYNYAGQPQNSSIFYNSAQSGTYYKSGCTGCLAGSAVTYTVPANTYSGPTQGEADQQATNDIAANGQAYADANGTCVTPSNATVTGSNANAQTQTFRFHNNCTGTDYNFSMGPSASLSTLGTIPVGNYNVIFNPPVGTGAYTYMVNGLTLHANSGTISNVTIGTGGAVVNITP